MLAREAQVAGAGTNRRCSQLKGHGWHQSTLAFGPFLSRGVVFWPFGGCAHNAPGPVHAREPDACLRASKLLEHVPCFALCCTLQANPLYQALVLSKRMLVNNFRNVGMFWIRLVMYVSRGW